MGWDTERGKEREEEAREAKKAKAVLLLIFCLFLIAEQTRRFALASGSGTRCQRVHPSAALPPNTARKRDEGKLGQIGSEPRRQARRAIAQTPAFHHISLFSLFLDKQRRAFCEGV